MKKSSIIVILISIVLTFGQNILAQGPPVPPNGNSHGQQGNQTPGSSGAPIGSGLGILLTLGAAYGTNKLYTRHLKNKKQE